MNLLPDAEPFSHDSPDTSIGVLVLHGFTGSPKSMKPWGRELAAQGWSVRVPRLPGHGTRWQDMNLTTWEDWYAEADRALIDDFLRILKQHRLDFTVTFRALFDAAAGNAARLNALMAEATDFADWKTRWQSRQPTRLPELLAAMQHANPCYIPRNHRVEAALDAAVDHNDLAPFERLLAVIRAPFEERPADAEFAEPAPTDFTAGYMTFCGT